jgi:peptidoglycan/LPS O-acetylase OafA/YrhL
VTVILALTVVGYFFQSSLSVNFIAGYINNNMVFFAFGILFSNVAGKKDMGSTPVLVTLAVLFVGFQYVFHEVMGLCFEDKGPALLVLALVSILFVVSLSARLSRTQQKWLKLLGASSMGIYLMHVLAGSGVRVILKSFLGIESVSVHLLAGFLVGLVLPVIVIMLINKFNIPFVISAPVSKAFGRRKNRQILSAGATSEGVIVDSLHSAADFRGRS